MNSSNEINDSDPDFQESLSGDTVTLTGGGSSVFAYANTSNVNTATGYAFKPTTDSLFASASLATAELRAFASLEFGTNQPGSSVIPVGVRNGSASASAMFADSFEAYTDATPFLWTEGTTASFSFDISGEYDIDPGIVDPEQGPGQPRNLIGTTLSFLAFESGGLDLWYQLSEFDWDAYATYEEADAAYLALNAELQSRIITNQFWYLGEPLTSTEIDPARVVPVQAGSPATLDVQFEPGGNFDWMLRLNSFIQLDASLQNVGATVDFSHTLVANYLAPEGTTTYSQSGLFPGTMSLATVPQPHSVPEPGTLLLVVTGVLGTLFVRRRRVALIPAR
jgi:hypothetical protein